MRRDVVDAMPGAKPLRSLLFQVRIQIEESALMSQGCSECFSGVGIADG